jgi:hypothetical protein
VRVPLGANFCGEAVYLRRYLVPRGVHAVQLGQGAAHQLHQGALAGHGAAALGADHRGHCQVRVCTMLCCLCRILFEGMLFVCCTFVVLHET